MIAKCLCQECANPIEFNVEGAGQRIECPHCGKETLLAIARMPRSVEEPKPQQSQKVTGDEMTFFESGIVKVTNARFIVGSQTFAMRGITSIDSVKQSPSYNGPVILSFIGVCMALCLFVDGSIVIGILGLLLLAAGIVVAVRLKPAFTVILRTASGEVTAYQSPSHVHIVEIIHALNQAIVSLG